MGRLERVQAAGATGEADGIWLLREHTFGRDPSSCTVLERTEISRHHARISWNGQAWTARDLSSRNGTWIDGRRIPEGDQVEIRQGARIGFGCGNDIFRLTDEQEPRAMLLAVETDGADVRIPLEAVLPVPSPDQPLGTVFLDARGTCLLELADGAVHELRHGQGFEVGGRHYRLVLATLPGTLPPTALAGGDARVEEARLEIGVAPDEESAEVIVVLGRSRRILPPKAHFYLLAFLARHRQADRLARASQDEADGGEGWIDCGTACKQLRISQELLAQQVFRIRKEIAEIDSGLSASILDRRLRGRIRIGLPPEQFQVGSLGGSPRPSSGT